MMSALPPKRQYNCREACTAAPHGRATTGHAYSADAVAMQATAGANNEVAQVMPSTHAAWHGRNPKAAVGVVLKWLCWSVLPLCYFAVLGRAAASGRGTATPGAPAQSVSY
jgi:hypothetical protein